MGEKLTKFKEWSSNRLADAQGLTDEQIFSICKQAVEKADKNAVIDHGEYEKRIQRLMKNVKSINGIPIDIKVYITNEINACAYHCNAIRVNSGLMDCMKDNELMAIIGHEVGHIVNGDTKRDLLNSSYFEKAANLIKTIFPGIIKSFALDMGVEGICAHYSRIHEEKADDFGLKFSVEQGYPASSMADALDILVKIEAGERSSLIDKFFAEHPDSADRAKRLREQGDQISRHQNGEY